MTNLPTNEIEHCIVLADDDAWLRGYKPNEPARAQLTALKAHISNIEHELTIVRAWNVQSDDRVEELRADNALAWQLVEEARVMVMSWGEYADDYVKGRHNYNEDIGRLEYYLAKHEGETK